MAEITERVASLEGSHKYLATKEDVAELKGNITELKGELKGLATKEDVAKLKGDIAELKGEVRMAIKAMSIGVPVVLVLIQIVFKYAIP